MRITEIGLVSGKVFETESAEVIRGVRFTEIRYSSGHTVRVMNNAIAFITLREEGGDASS